MGYFALWRLKYEALSIPASQLCSMILGSFFLFSLAAGFLILSFYHPKHVERWFCRDHCYSPVPPSSVASV